jgi:hypothetical protein
MPGNARDMIASAERRFPVRIRIGVPPGGLGQRYAEIAAWLDENCGADGWAMTPSGMRGVLNDAVSIYFLDATPASAFVARWCAGYKIETADGVFRVRTDEPTLRTTASMHRTLAGCSASSVSIACRPAPNQCWIQASLWSSLTFKTSVR